MAKTITIRRMGQTMKEGTVVKWYKNDGDTVKKGDHIYEMEYDKASTEMDSPADGILKIVHENGTFPVGTVVAKVYEQGESIEETPDIKESSKTASPVAATTGDQSADAIVIGGGPGGYVAALKLAMNGKKTILVERDKVGGTCLNRGCIPTKALLHSAEVLDTVKESAKSGIKVTGYTVDTKAVNDRKDGVVKQLVGGVEYLLSKRKVEVIRGEASFTGEKSLRIALTDGTSKDISADNIIIAAGSESSKIPIPGIDGKNVITSTEALDFDNLPKELVIIGGGVIGMEIGSVYAKFGTKVTVLEALPRILPNLDQEITAEFRKHASAYMQIETSAKVCSISDSGAKKQVEFELDGAKKTIMADKVMVCVGRRPETAALALDKAGIVLDRNRIKTNDAFETNVPGVYAIGDVNGKVLLAHAASAQGIFVAEKICGIKSEINLDLVPSCIYTKPEIACVGKTEEQLKEEGKEYQVGKFPFQANGKSLAMGEPDGFIKILAGKEYGEILGAHMIGPRATDMIAELALAINSECTVDEIANTIHAHPTVSEAVMEAAEAVKGHAIHNI
ncbi:MAG: dihydrolipoyl dehydrogenase [Christensenella sp.]|nr:dihydrolipoyl dehydrogenase [Christensenella sp.]